MPATAVLTNSSGNSAESAFLFPSELGWIALTYAGERLTRISFGHASSVAMAASLPTGISLIGEEGALPASIAKTVERLQRFASGGVDDFADVQLDLSHLSDFQRRVVKACRKIKSGQVRSYGELAARAGSPRAARAVGSVMRNNRFPLIVPCHRVIASGGKLGGFSCPDGLAMKERLLQREARGPGGSDRSER